MKREVIYRTDAMAALGNLKGLSDTDKSKAMQAILDVFTVQTCEDAVSRADVLETYADLYDVFEDSKAICKELHKVYDRINALPAVQPQRKTDEWCTDCREYDSEKHCCPRWNRVIRETLSEQTKIIRCKDCRFQDKGSNESESWNLCGYRPWLHVPTEDEHYCGYAERRTDGSD